MKPDDAGLSVAEADEESIFNEARRITEPEARENHLRQACAGNDRLRRRVDGLLQVEYVETHFLETPAVAPGPFQAIHFDQPVESVIGPYQLEDKLGEGGFGVVYRARQDVPVRRTVALKLVKPGMGSGEVIARFEAERQALALMDHPHIARVLDAGQTAAGRPWFVMELVEGTSLCQFADSRKLTLRERLLLFGDVCAAVGHAHQKGIIHRDLKPSNLLVAEKDGALVMKVIDFGIAKAIGVQLTENPVVTQQLQLVGTPAYMSPEQIDGGAAGIDTRSDIYSLGAILYELLTGTTPVGTTPSGSLPEMLDRIRSCEPVKPSQFWSGAGERATHAACRQLDPNRLARLCRDDLDWIVLKCLEKDRERRYATANALRDDVNRFLEGLPVEAGPPSTVYRLRKFIRRHRGWLAAAATILALVIAGSGVSIWQGWRAWRNGQLAEGQATRALQEKMRAEDEAAVARAINDFLLTDLLSQSDSANQSRESPRQRDLTVRELLDRAAERIETRFRDQPRTEAAVRLTVGESLAGLGEFGPADPHLRRAVELLEAELGSAAAETLNARRKLAWNCRAMANHAEARSILEEVLSIQVRASGPLDRETLRTQNVLSAVLQSTGQLQQAHALIEKTWQSRLEQFGPDDPDTRQSFANLAAINLELGRHQVAIPQLREIVDYRRRQGGDDHPQTVTALQGLASALIRTGKFDEARGLLEEAHELSRDSMAPDHPRVLDLNNDLAILLEMSGEAERAEELYEEVLTGRLARLGPDHPDTLSVQSNLATLYATLGRSAEAEGMMRGVLAELRKKVGNESPETVMALSNLAFLLLDSGRPAEAEPLAAEAVAAARKTMGEGNADTRVVLHNWVLALAQTGSAAAVEPLLREALNGLEEAGGEASTAVADEQAWLALCLLSQNRLSEARGLARQALGTLDRAGRDGWHRQYVLALTGAIAAARSDVDQATEMLVEAATNLHELQATLPHHARPRVRQAFEWLIDHLEKQGDPLRAEKFRALRDETLDRSWKLSVSQELAHRAG
jgi:eukaryotic-like serine/threonine-protein kinase